MPIEINNTPSDVFQRVVKGPRVHTDGRIACHTHNAVLVAGKEACAKDVCKVLCGEALHKFTRPVRVYAEMQVIAAAHQELARVAPLHSVDTAVVVGQRRLHERCQKTPQTDVFVLIIIIPKVEVDA